MDIASVAGFRKMRFWRNRDDVTMVRWYRVPVGTPCLPIPSAFMRTDWLEEHPAANPGDPGVLVGEYDGGGKYDRGALPVGWRPPIKFIGTPEQWLQGSEFPRHQPLVWRGGFSTACKAGRGPQGMACAECVECGLVSPIWIADGFADFGGLTQAALVHTEHCEFSSRCVPGPGAPTAAAWEVVPERAFGGLTGGVIYSQDHMVWSGCCPGVV